MSNNVQTTFQSRLTARQNKIARKLIDNNIRLSGTISDCIKISLTKTPQGDIQKRKIEGMDVIPIVFPPMVDIPIRKVSSLLGTKVIPYTFEIQPIEVLIPTTAKIDQDDLIVKFYENLEGEEPYIAILECKDMLGTFGGRSIIYNKYKLTFFDGTLPDKVVEWALDMARRRQVLHW